MSGKTQIFGDQIVNGTITNAQISATATISASKITPPGSTLQLTYNNAGVFAGTANITTDGTNLTLASGTLNANSLTGVSSGLTLRPFSDSSTALRIQNAAGTVNGLTFNSSNYTWTLNSPDGQNSTLLITGGGISGGTATLTLQPGTSATPAQLILTNQANGSGQTGGFLTLTSNPSGGSSLPGGDITLTSGGYFANSTFSGRGGNINLTTASFTGTPSGTVGGAGGSITLTSGNAGTVVSSTTLGSTGAGGGITLTSGGVQSSTTASGNSGSILITTGDLDSNSTGNSGNGGSITLTTGTAQNHGGGTKSGNGGNITLSSGTTAGNTSGSTTGTGGSITLTSGTPTTPGSNTAGAGGSITLTSGNGSGGGGNPGPGGSITLTTGTGGANGASGGNVTLTAGNPVNGGNLSLTGTGASHGTITAGGNMAIDGTTFNVDSVNHRVGIATSSPSQMLDIGGGHVTWNDSTATFTIFKPAINNTLIVGDFSSSGVVSLPGFGQVRFGDVFNSGNFVAIQAPHITTSYVMKWPVAQANVSGQALTNDAAGNLSWTTIVSSPAGSNTQVQYNNSGSFGASPNLTFDGTTLSVGTITLNSSTTNMFVPGNITTASKVILQGAQAVQFNQTNNASSVSISAPTSGISTYSLILPPTQGGAGTSLTNDGSGNLSWATGGTGSVTQNTYTVGTPSGTYTGSTTLFNLPFTYVQDGKSLQVMYNGQVLVSGVDYNETSNTSVTFTSALTAGYTAQFRYITPQSPSNTSVAQYANFVIGTPSGTYTGSTTVYNLPFAYTQNAKSLEVFYDGVQLVPGDDYTETTSTSITTTQALTSGQKIAFRTISTIGNAAAVTQLRENYVVGTPSGNYTGSTTVFNLINSFTPGGINLLVYLDGDLQTIGAGNDYVETNSTTVTFTNTLTSGQTVSFLFSQTVAATGTVTTGTANTLAAYNSAGSTLASINANTSAGGFKITSVATGTAPTDAAVVGQVPILTAWTAWTPTFTGFGSVTNIAFWYRRVGDTIEVRGTATAGTTAATTGKISLPNSYTIDISKSASMASFGWFLGGSGGNPWWSNNFAAIPFYDGSDNTGMFFAKSNNVGTSVLKKENVNNIAVANEIFQMMFTFPATGLGVSS